MFITEVDINWYTIEIGPHIFDAQISYTTSWVYTIHWQTKKKSVGNHWIDTFEWILNGKQWAPVIQTFRLEFVLFNDLAQMKIKQLVSIGNFTSAICLHFKINYIFIICLNNWNYFCIPLIGTNFRYWHWHTWRTHAIIWRESQYRL